MQFDQLKRRELITLLGGATLAWPLAARAQQVPVVGILQSQTQASEAAIERGLQDASFVVGRNVTIEHRFADGRNDRLPALAAELVHRRIDVVGN